MRNGPDGFQQQRLLVEIASRFLICAPSVRIKSTTLGSVPGKWFIPTETKGDEILFYIHGGAFVYGSSTTHQALVSWLSRYSGLQAVSIDYRRAPEHAFPAALEDCLSVYQWLIGQGYPADKIFIAGDSAGANLALALTISIRERGHPNPCGVICFSPVVDLTQIDALNDDIFDLDPVLVPSDTELLKSYIGPQKSDKPLISPLFANLKNFPPVTIHVGGEELLKESAKRFYVKALADGVQSEFVVWPGMWHVFQAYMPYLPEAKQSLKKISDFIKTYA
jgi:acetyl esterase/lipase